MHHGKYEPKASMVQDQMISAVFTPLHNSKNKYCLENCPGRGHFPEIQLVLLYLKSTPSNNFTVYI